MSKVYDSWDRLVGAVLKREELRRLERSHSLTTSMSASSRQSDFSYADVQPIQFNEINKATNIFRRDPFIGEAVPHQACRGWIDEQTLTASNPGYGTAVAVKWKQGGLHELQEWLEEMKYLSKLHHQNLVKFIGYCWEEENMISVHEFMPRGSLDEHLFTRWHQSIPWEIRIKVATDAARGLSYLHDREIPVIHRDIKTANILLDGGYNAKLTGLNLAIDGPIGDMTGASTQVFGTYGYAAPEYVATGWLTTKCDVYSFGVVLLELLSGSPVIDKNGPMKEQGLVQWAKPYLGDKRKLMQIMDSRLKGQFPRTGAYKFAKLALRCLSSDPKQRPRMDEVVVALQQL